ncbi:MAG: hypothetical protein IPK25_08650 [Saprospiraceae bacterium]|nr:hypothetical protein [Saprospiraceae bacterium]
MITKNFYFQRIKLFPILLLICSGYITEIQCQHYFKIYHGKGGLTKVLDKDGKEIGSNNIKMMPGDVVKIEILNYNPLFYNYVLKYKNFKIESESGEIDKFISLLNPFYSGIIYNSREGFAGEIDSTTNPNLDKYKKALDILLKELEKANNILINSEEPEDFQSALIYSSNNNGGLRQAIENIKNMEKKPFHFNNVNLIQDLNKLSDAIGGDEVQKSAYHLLNQSLVGKINQVKK